MTSPLSQLPYTVIRIRAGDLSVPGAVHSGTGFFYSINVNGKEVSLVVSNKHVICKKKWVEFDFGSSDPQGKRILGPSNKVRVDAGMLPIFEHPDPEIDLAAMPLVPIVDQMEKRGMKPHTLYLTKQNFASEAIEAVLHPATSVLMVGFPNGIMDEKNNLPVVRRGSLATPYAANYQGKSDFVVDIAAFGGSSGSPVFAFFENMLPDEHGNINFTTEPQIFLLGVLHSGPQMTAAGEIVPIPVPTVYHIAQTNVMIHLGYCLKAKKIEELGAIIKKYL